MANGKPPQNRTRVPNKVIWNLEETLALLITARQEWQRIVDYSERAMDPRLSLPVARLGFTLSEMERLTRNARDGRYEEQHANAG
jgi:hypothetical protein